jgi:antirestriction protein ArdC
MSNQVYGYITDKIMEELEHGCVPWHKPWKSPDGVRVPMNYASKKPYRGVNTFLLAVSRSRRATIHGRTKNNACYVYG